MSIETHKLSVGDQWLVFASAKTSEGFAMVDTVLRDAGVSPLGPHAYSLRGDDETPQRLADAIKGLRSGDCVYVVRPRSTEIFVLVPPRNEGGINVRQ